MLRIAAILLIFCPTLSAATYYVSPKGNDANPGTTEDRPFRVVQHAIDRMKAGDTLIVLDGRYSGTLSLKSGITIKAKNPRKVIFSGAHRLNARFEKHGETIYKAKISGAPKRLFQNGKPLTWARWPNCDWSENWIEEKKWKEAAKGTGPSVLTSRAFKDIAKLDLVGGYCFLRYGKGNSCYSRRIEAFDGRTLRWNDDDFYEQKFTGEDGWRGAPGHKIKEGHHYHPMSSEFYLVGKLALLDAPGEWIVVGDTLYLYPLDNSDPNESGILVQTQGHVVDQQEAIENVTIEGVDFVAASVNFSDKSNRKIALRNSHFSYIGSELLFVDRVKGNLSQKPITVNGTGINIEKCLFSGAEHSALRIRGEDVTIVNNVFIENNRNAVFEGRPLSIWPDGYYKVSRNTFINNCSDAIYIRWEHIDIPPKQSETSYNFICNTGVYHSDTSGIYMPSRSQGYLKVHHNWLTRINGNSIRLDISGKHLIVNHNVIWNSKRGLNIEGHGDFMVYNNTSMLNHEADTLILNQVKASKAVPEGWATEDYTFPPIGIAPNDNWYVYNNVIQGLFDKAKGREYREHGKKPSHPERKKQSIIMKNRGSIQGNMIQFKKTDAFRDLETGTVDFRPTKKAEAALRTGTVKPEKMTAPRNYVASLGNYKGAYEPGGEYWYPGSDWLPYGLEAPKTMAEADTLAKRLCQTSIVPELGSKELPAGMLNNSE